VKINNFKNWKLLLEETDSDQAPGPGETLEPVHIDPALRPDQEDLQQKEETLELQSQGGEAAAEVKIEPIESQSSSLTLSYAKSQIGVPYRWGGQSPKGSTEPLVTGSKSPGFDCSGFVKWVLKSSGQFNMPDGTLDTKTYSSFPGHAPGQKKLAAGVERSDLKAGDLVFFKSDPSFNGAGHVGLVSSVTDGDFSMIHASSKRGIQEISEVQKKGWWGPILGYGRWTNPNINADVKKTEIK
jgi:cell wall-associated NlpC family hydrolase